MQVLAASVHLPDLASDGPAALAHGQAVVEVEIPSRPVPLWPILQVNVAHQL